MNYFSMMLFNCTNCPCTNELYSSKIIECETCQVNNNYDVNICLVIVMQEIDQVQSIFGKLSGFLNMQPLFNKNLLSKIHCKIKTGYKDVAEESINNAANELNERNRVGIADETVLCGGIWLKKATVP